MKQFEVVVDGEACNVSLGSDACELRGRRMAADITRLGADHYSLIIDGAQHTVVISRTANGSYEALVAGATMAVAVRDPRSLSQPASGSAAGSGQVRAPMPGKVLAVHVAVGDEVTRGQGLLVVEAMKMQNELRAPADGRIAAVSVGTGDSVASGDTLVVVA